MSRLSDHEIECQLLWKLARSHAWARWIPVNELVGALPRSERGRARRDVLPTLRTDPRIVFQRGSGYRINHGEVDALAYGLRDDCCYSELRIEATLSHFEGFRSRDR